MYARARALIKAFQFSLGVKAFPAVRPVDVTVLLHRATYIATGFGIWVMFLFKNNAQMDVHKP